MSTNGELGAKRPHPFSALWWEAVGLALAGLVAAVAIVAAAGWVGYAITGKLSWVVAGGGIAVVVVVVVFQRFILREGAVEIAVSAVTVFVCLAMLYCVTRIVEEKLEAASQHPVPVAPTAIDR